MPRRNRPAKLGMVDARKPRLKRSRWVDTGTFGAHRAPALRGVDPDTAYAVKQNARAARRAEKAWLRTLPKGVTL